MVLTTSSSELDRDKSFQLGANDFLIKPNSQHDFVRMLLQVASKWQLIQVV